jgi:hypothetical protein
VTIPTTIEEITMTTNTEKNRNTYVPYNATGDKSTDLILVCATAFLRSWSDLLDGNPDAKWAEHLKSTMYGSMVSLARFERLPLEAPQKIFLDALFNIRETQSALIEKHGDLLNNPAPFGVVYSETVLVMVRQMQSKMTAAEQAAANEQIASAERAAAAERIAAA